MATVSVSDFSDYLLSQGFSKHGAAAIIGNAMQESGLNTEKLGDKGSSFGLFQWRLNRYNNLKAFAKGNDINDWKIQAQYLVYELKNNFPTLYKSLLNSTDEKTSTLEFSNLYENPNPLYANNTARTKNAEYALQVINKQVNDTGNTDKAGSSNTDKKESSDTGIVGDAKKAVSDFYESVKSDLGKYLLDILFIIIGVFILYTIIQTGFGAQLKGKLL